MSSYTGPVRQQLNKKLDSFFFTSQEKPLPVLKGDPPIKFVSQAKDGGRYFYPATTEHLVKLDDVEFIPKNIILHVDQTIPIRGDVYWPDDKGPRQDIVSELKITGVMDLELYVVGSSMGGLVGGYRVSGVDLEATEKTYPSKG